MSSIKFTTEKTADIRATRRLKSQRTLDEVIAEVAKERKEREKRTSQQARKR